MASKSITKTFRRLLMGSVSHLPFVRWSTYTNNSKRPVRVDHRLIQPGSSVLIYRVLGRTTEITPPEAA